MKILYFLGIELYYIAIFLAQFFNSKAKKWIIGRKLLWNQIPTINFDEKEVLWFHCASLGEFDQAIPLIQKIKEYKPESFLLLTFFSPSGFEHYTKRKISVDLALYLPLDTPKNAKKWCAIFKPSMTFFVKYEFWFFQIQEAKKYGKVYSICSLFRENQIYFKWYGKYLQKQLHLIHHFFVQNEFSKRLLNKVGIHQVSVVGDMRYDRVLEFKNKAPKNVVCEEFIKGEKAWIIGSSWAKDEIFLEESIKKIGLEKKIIIAAHDISEKHLLSIEQRFENTCIRYSNWNNNSSASILLIDCIGILNSLYQYADVAYVGGGFTGKLHNILEPAVYGMGILIGPKFSRFPEAEELKQIGVVFPLNNKVEIEEKFNFILQNKQKIAEKVALFLESQKGAAKKIIQEIGIG
ncbi:MAG: 3-deoxy-D-manno-octulosonic acid transferase [Flavobacteriia bacterium]|nr:3-deoxy-D-manno-octulosonic acid transferase [Flavobacteriia bacterium]